MTASNLVAVSYTHLDVYKRQALANGFGKVHGQARVAFQLGLDGLQHHSRLLKGVPDDDRIPLAEICK